MRKIKNINIWESLTALLIEVEVHHYQGWSADNYYNTKLQQTEFTGVLKLQQTWNGHDQNCWMYGVMNWKLSTSIAIKFTISPTVLAFRAEFDSRKVFNLIYEQANCVE